jgi:hypothetical protein
LFCVFKAFSSWLYWQKQNVIEVYEAKTETNLISFAVAWLRPAGTCRFKLDRWRLRKLVRAQSSRCLYSAQWNSLSERYIKLDDEIFHAPVANFIALFIVNQESVMVILTNQQIT